MNIIAVVCARDLKDRELCGGFLASKGFDTVNGTIPSAVLVDSFGKSKGIAAEAQKTFAGKKVPRLIVVQVAKKTDRKPKGVDELYQIVPTKDKTKLFLALEAIIRKEKDISRGSKPKCRISVPV